MKRIYYDSLLNGLIPVKQVTTTGDNRARGIVSKDFRAYRTGMEITDFSYRFVNIVCRNKYKTLIKPAQLNEV